VKEEEEERYPSRMDLSFGPFVEQRNNPI